MKNFDNFCITHFFFRHKIKGKRAGGKWHEKLWNVRHGRQRLRQEMQHSAKGRTADCDSREGESCLREPEFAVAMAYVPWQYFKETYELDKALEIGTIFPELDRPFMGRRGMVR